MSQHSSKLGLWHSLLLSLATLFIIFGCMDTEDSNIIYPESMSYEAFDIKDVQGTIYVSENKWKFHPDDHTIFYPRPLGDEQGLSILISNMKEEYKQYNEVRVKISGKARFLHTILSPNPAGGPTEVFSVEIKDIEAI